MSCLLQKRRVLEIVQHGLESCFYGLLFSDTQSLCVGRRLLQPLRFLYLASDKIVDALAL